MLDKPTNELNELLRNAAPEKIGKYLEENREHLAGDEKAFSYYYKSILEQKKIRLKDVYVFADVSESYGYKILSMERHTTNRDLIIRFCLAGRFSLMETNRALKLYGMSELYAKDPRDACIIVALNNRMFDLGEIDSLLTKNKLEKLSKEN